MGSTPAPLTSCPQLVILSWLDRERLQPFIINLNEIAALNYNKEIDSEFIIWRNIDRKVAQKLLFFTELSAAGAKRGVRSLPVKIVTSRRSI